MIKLPLTRYNPSMMASSPDGLIGEMTQDGCRIVRKPRPDILLLAYYRCYNQQCFDGTFAPVPIFWAKSIFLPCGSRANGLYVYEESPTKRYIVLDEKLSDMFPLERLCLLHEMVHLKIEPICGHGEEFVGEFKRVLDASH